MSLDYPLLFEPIFQQYLWGGRRLGEVLGKTIAEEGVFAESWEVVDHGEHQSIVLNGPQAGISLKQLVANFNYELFGRHAPQKNFPLLFKFLDANLDLSVQVHPDDAQAALLDPPDLGKTEAWIVLAAEPGAKLYAGLKSGVTKEDLIAATQASQTDQVLNVIEPSVGDCLFIPARSIHALGSGLLVAEIQQSSNTTFRLFDWNRVDAQGKSRPLHIEQSLETIDFDQGPIGLQTPVLSEDETIEQLVASDYFVLDRWNFSGQKSLGGDGRFHLVSVLEGSIKVDHSLVTDPLVKGQSFLLPAEAGAVSINTGNPSILLDIYLP